MLNIRNYITTPGISFVNGVLIIPGVLYDELCDRFPETYDGEIISWKHVDEWIHNTFGTDKFVLSVVDEDHTYNWNEETQQYE